MWWLWQKAPSYVGFSLRTCSNSLSQAGLPKWVFCLSPVTTSRSLSEWSAMFLACRGYTKRACDWNKLALFAWTLVSRRLRHVRRSDPTWSGRACRWGSPPCLSHPSLSPAPAGGQQTTRRRMFPDRANRNRSESRKQILVKQWPSYSQTASASRCS